MQSGLENWLLMNFLVAQSYPTDQKFSLQGNFHSIAIIFLLSSVNLSYFAFKVADNSFKFGNCGTLSCGEAAHGIQRVPSLFV